MRFVSYVRIFNKDFDNWLKKHSCHSSLTKQKWDLKTVINVQVTYSCFCNSGSASLFPYLWLENIAVK